MRLNLPNETTKHYSLQALCHNFSLKNIFTKRYKDNYKFLLKINDDTCDYKIACEKAWEKFCLKAKKEKENSLIFIPQLVKNILCTDREIAAFMYTIKEFNVMDW